MFYSRNCSNKGKEAGDCQQINDGTNSWSFKKNSFISRKTFSTFKDLQYCNALMLCVNRKVLSILSDMNWQIVSCKSKAFYIMLICPYVWADFLHIQQLQRNISLLLISTKSWGKYRPLRLFNAAQSSTDSYKLYLLKNNAMRANSKVTHETNKPSAGILHDIKAKEISTFRWKLCKIETLVKCTPVVFLLGAFVSQYNKWETKEMLTAAKIQGVWKIIENKQKLVKHILKTYFLSMLLDSSVTF